MARSRCWWPRSSFGSWGSASISSSRATGPRLRPSQGPKRPPSSPAWPEPSLPAQQPRATSGSSAGGPHPMSTTLVVSAARRGVIDAAPSALRRRLGSVIVVWCRVDGTRVRRRTVPGMESIVATEPTPKDTGRDRPSYPDPGSRGHIGWIVAGSLATGLVAAVPLCRRPVHPGRGECRHWRSPLRIRPRLGDVGGALGPVHRSAAAMGRGSGTVHGTGRPAPGGIWLPGAPGAQLGVAPRHAGVGGLADRLCPSTAAEPGRTLAAVPSDRDAGAGLDRRRLPEPG